MSLSLLFKDELRGFYKSKVMLVLWIGLPALVFVLRIINPSVEEMPLTLLSAIIISSIGGTLAAVMLAVSIIHEKDKNVYDLYLVRPVKRRNIVISKFSAVYLCISIASGLALLTGLLIDLSQAGSLPMGALEKSVRSLITSLSMMAVSSAAGLLIGVVSPEVLVGAILVIYGGNQISVLPSLPSILGISDSLIITVSLGVGLSIILVALAVLFFNRKQF